MEHGYNTEFRTFKHQHLFVVDDENGFIPADNLSGMGFYYQDTRFLSKLEIYINGQPPMTLLSSAEAGNMSTLVYTNTQVEARINEQQIVCIPKETIMVKRESVLNEAWFEKFTLVNYNDFALPITLSFHVSVDFLDIFEVRNLVGLNKEVITDVEVNDNTITFIYKDSVGLTLKTSFVFEDFTPTIDQHTSSRVDFHIRQMLNPLEQRRLNFKIQPFHEGKITPPVPAGYAEAVEANQAWSTAWNFDSTEFCTDNDDFNEMLQRGFCDLRMLTTPTRDPSRHEESYIAAGIPWYVALFGRDSIITARQCLILKPDLAKSTLRLLAHYQGKQFDSWKEEEPGKILHELRTGELARNGKIPHVPYYGSVDATPLWIMLLYDYYLWTNDRETLEELWPNALAAMEWIDRNLENGHGYLAYKCQSSGGLRHQGWKDSFNSAMYEDGRQAEPPLYLSEVQGYVYLAKNRMARLATVLESRDMAANLLRECRKFKHRFNQDFWINDLKYCALALDQEGQPLRVISSNPGHCLETGIFTDTHARFVARRLMQPDMFTDWGIRTLSGETKSYNPMSYHNGSIWPHDNAMIARGFAVIGQADYVDRVFSAIFDVSRHMHYRRLPELFCGFLKEKDKIEPPVKYPVSCSPQAWAATAVFSLLQSTLNLHPRWKNKALWLRRPRLPQWLNYLRIRNLHVQGYRMDMELRRTHNTVMVDVLDRNPAMDILIEI